VQLHIGESRDFGFAGEPAIGQRKSRPVGAPRNDSFFWIQCSEV
jgi:hypothetical protein